MEGTSRALEHISGIEKIISIQVKEGMIVFVFVFFSPDEGKEVDQGHDCN